MEPSIPEGQWKLLEQPGHVGSSVGNVATHKDVDQKIKAHAPAKATDEVIEPSYVILDTEKHHEPVEEFETMDNMQEKIEIGEDERQEFMLFVKNIILNTLKVEVGHGESAGDMIMMEPSLAEDVELVASAVSFSVGHDKRCAPSLKVEHDGVDCTSERVGILHGEDVIRAISSAVHETRFLGRVLPFGVIVGSCLAALRNFFVVATVHDYGQTDALTLPAKICGEKDLGKASGTETHHRPADKSDQNTRLDSSVTRKGEMSGLKNINNTVVVGAVTAALGSSALLVEHQENTQDSYNDEETSESSSKSLVNGNGQREPDKLEEAMSEKNQNDIVTSLAEKAMSVTGPVVPTKEVGGVDQERRHQRNGTTIMAFFMDGGILMAADSRATLYGLKAEDTEEKIFKISANIVIGIAGTLEVCLAVVSDVKACVLSITEEIMVEHVADLAVEHMVRRLADWAAEHLTEQRDKSETPNVETALICAGWDSQGLHIFELSNDDNPVVKKRVKQFKVIGTGRRHAGSILEESWMKQGMNVRYSEAAALASIFHAEIFDKGTGGPIGLCRITGNGVEMKEKICCFRLYSRFWKIYDTAKDTLFLLNHAHHRQYAAYEVNNHFKEYGQVLASHVVGKMGKFWFYRIIFSQANEARSALLRTPTYSESLEPQPEVSQTLKRIRIGNFVAFLGMKSQALYEELKKMEP